MDLLDTKIYSMIGEDGFARLVNAFYRRVPADDILGPMYKQHGDLSGPEVRLRLFLIQSFGGQRRYSQQRGHPRLRMRHAPFQVDQRARDRWIELMEQALGRMKFEQQVDRAVAGILPRRRHISDQPLRLESRKYPFCGTKPASQMFRVFAVRRVDGERMKIAVMPGDGVGKEVVAEGLKVLKVAAQKFGFTYDTTDYPFGAEHYLKTKITLPDSALKELAAHDAILFGAVGADPRGNAQIPQGLIETDILLKMRFELDQYINLRPTRLLPGVPTPLANVQPGDIDMVIVRENTEGLYCQNGGFLYKDTPHEVANQIEVTTRHGVERAIRYAFEYAKQHNRKKVTLVAKTNVLRFAHNLWMRAFEEVKGDYAGIETGLPSRRRLHDVHGHQAEALRRDRHDQHVRRHHHGPGRRDSGRHGHGRQRAISIPTRQAASMFEPVHGSAPDIAGKNFANPIATFLSVAMMLDFLEQPKAAKAINTACQEVVADPKNHTRDLGGTATTTAVGESVCTKVAG